VRVDDEYALQNKVLDVLNINGRYFLAGIVNAGGVENANAVESALRFAVTASGIACERQGAIPSIPTMPQVYARMQTI
jgi:sugar/nucleoside kinase (ribokinase family)